jgi:UDP-N-acetylmuramate dehydrogenase
MTGSVLEMDKQEMQRALEAALGTSADVRFNEPMRNHTSLHMGGPADAYVAPDAPETLSRVLVLLRQAGFPSLPLGGGTNLLVRDAGIEGTVIHMKRFDSLEISDAPDGTVTVRAGAGLGLQRLLGRCRSEGLSGLEALAGIPGEIGGAVAGNAGAFGTEIKDVLVTIELVTADGELIELERKKVDFAYRSANLPEGVFITGVTLRLTKDSPEEVARRMDEAHTKKRATQPLGQWSAGCVFKNPPGDAAGRLIDAAGCKGMRRGDIVVSDVHANFFINTGEGRADDFLRLMDQVGQMVRETSSMVLEPEIRIVGR